MPSSKDVLGTSAASPYDDASAARYTQKKTDTEISGKRWGSEEKLPLGTVRRSLEEWQRRLRGGGGRERLSTLGMQTHQRVLTFTSRRARKPVVITLYLRVNGNRELLLI